jgi:hypothetical protein
MLGEEWDGGWPPYAAMLAIEIYSTAHPDGSTEGDERNRNDHFFRIVYNGQPLLLPTCNDSLCALEKLFEALSFGHEGPEDACQARRQTDTHPVPNTATLLPTSLFTLSTEQWIVIVIVASFVSSLLGACIISVAYSLPRPLPSRLYREIPSQEL